MYINQLEATKIEHFNVVIVGGGVAGIAIAEFLARHSNLSIKVLEKEEKLGTGASGKLEGWFHTGALYSGQDDAQTFLNCVNSVEDLVNLYSHYFVQKCNVKLVEKKSNFFSPKITKSDEGWFNDRPVYLIHPQTDAPEIKLSSLKSDAMQIKHQRDRVLGRLEVAYGNQHNWLENSKCVAPTYEKIENYEGLNCTLRDAIEEVQNLGRKFDASYGVMPSSYEIVKTLDCSMNTSAILQDLVMSALNEGVDFETGVDVNKMLVDRYGKVRVKSLLCSKKNYLPKQIKADLFIFTVGSFFDSFLSDLQIRARLKQNRSGMIVASPALVDTNFVRMSSKNKFHFNHFIQHYELEGEKLTYSMLADSNYTKDDSDNDLDIDLLLESAERYFGKEKLYDRELFSYECVKTEFVSQEEQKRRYSYWIESTPKSNYMCVLPGKFSFFPTVALQAYERIKTLINFEESVSQSKFEPNIDVKNKAQELVAQHYPIQILNRGYAPKI